MLDARLVDGLELGPVPVLVMLLVLRDPAREVRGHVVLGPLADLDRLAISGDPLELAPGVAFDHRLRALADGEHARLLQVPKRATRSPSSARFGTAGTVRSPFEASVGPILLPLPPPLPRASRGGPTPSTAPRLFARPDRSDRKL